MGREYKYIRISALVITSIIYLTFSALAQSKVLPLQEEFFYVKRVIDGDTLELSNRQRIRLIGIDTPELHYGDKLLRDSKRNHQDIKTIQELGKRAANFTGALCLGKKVHLEYDVEKKDKYGRTLAYVYLEDGTFVNAKILEEGFAQVLTIPPNVKYADFFSRLQKEARDRNKGLWAEEVAR